MAMPADVAPVQEARGKVLQGDGPDVLIQSMHRLPCGCWTIAGLRMDLWEATVVNGACRTNGHGSAVERAQERFRTMPPSPRPAIELMVELVAQEIGVAGQTPA